LFIALNCILILQHFQQKKEVNGEFKYKIAAQEKKKKAKKIRSACILGVLYTSIYVLLG
jgi:hypothetical protein